MESVYTIYQLTTTLMTMYGYWKIAHTGYYYYHNITFLYNVSVYILNKIHKIFNENKENISPEMEISLKKIKSIAEDMNIESIKSDDNLSKNKEFYSIIDNTYWEIICIDDINESDSPKLNEEKPLITQKISYLPDILSFVYYLDEDDKIVSAEL